MAYTQYDWYIKDSEIEYNSHYDLTDEEIHYDLTDEEILERIDIKTIENFLRKKKLRNVDKNK